MTYKSMEGQMDFLGLLNEYKDSQGASVRVREPGNRRTRLSFADGPEQLSLDFGIKVSDGEEAESFREEKKETICVKDVNENGEFSENRSMSNDFYDADRTASGSEDFHTREAVKEESPNQTESFRAESSADVLSKDETTKEETKPKTSKHKEPKAGEQKKQNRELLFKQCSRCWCFDCKHNSRNEAVPREMCGAMMPCPACDGCISEDCATICEIGNAKEGCMTRAKEEGIAQQEDFVY